MVVPSNSINVGWFKSGPRPGDKGDALIAGHFDDKNGEIGVFNKLDKLKIGDKLSVENDKGVSIYFTVLESRIYNLYEDIPEITNQGSGYYLNLITCDGVWDKNQKSYTKRLVVFTERLL